MKKNSNEQLEDFRLRERFIFTIGSLIRSAEARLTEGLSKNNLNRTTWAALTSIQIEQKRSPSDLATHMGISRPAVSRMLKQLEADNLIERQLIGDDARARLLSVTEFGREQMHKNWPHVRDTDTHFLNKLTDEEVDQLWRILQKVAEGEYQLSEEL